MGTITVNFGSGVSAANITAYNGTSYETKTYYSTQTFSNSNTSRYIQVTWVGAAANYKNATSSNWGKVYFNSGNQYIYLSATYDPPAPTYYYAYLYFNANGGSGAPSTQTAYATSNGVSKSIAIPSTTPSYTGWTFAGWSESSTAIYSSYSPGGSISVNTGSSKTLYAIWHKTVSLTYDANGGYLSTYGSETSHSFSYVGTPNGNQVTVKSESDLRPVQNGYNFSTWNTASNGSGSTYNPGETIGMYGSNRTLYAIWTIKTYTVTVNPNGGSFSNGSHSTQSITVAFGGTYDFGRWVPTKTGYALLGWAASSDATTATYAWNDTYTVNETNNKSWYAVWKINTWRLTLNANGGAFPEGSPYNGSTTYSVKKDYNSTTSLRAYSNAVSREDERINGYSAYKFEIVGWDTNQNTSWLAVPDYQKNDTLTMPNNDLTLYAIWERLNCIRYFSNGRLFGNIDTVEYMGDYTVRSDEPIWGNHIFKGWSVNGYTSASDVEYHPGDRIYNITGYITLTACWGWEPMDEFYWNGSASADNAVFVSGEPVSDALLASGWNNFYLSLNTYLYRSSGSQIADPSYTQSGAKITASIFNAARGDLISSGAASYPIQVSSGDTVYLDYFVGTRGGRFSLRNSLNTLIAIFNASLED